MFGETDLEFDQGMHLSSCNRLERLEHVSIDCQVGNDFWSPIAEVHDLHVDAADLLRAGLGAAKSLAH